MAASKPTLEERFWSKVLKTPTCWLWQRQITANGYGCFSYRQWPAYAHRFAWRLTHGDIPDGLHVLHRCDIRHCVNPDHLFLGTRSDNMRDCAKKGRLKINRTGAKMSPEQVRAIRVDERAISAIAHDYGIAQRTVNAIRSRQSWRHID